MIQPPHHGRLGVRGHLVLAVELELDVDRVALGRDRGDLADLDAEDAHVGAREQPDGALELPVTWTSLVAGPEGIGAGHEGDHDERGDDLGDQAEAGSRGRASRAAGSSLAPPGADRAS